MGDAWMNTASATVDWREVVDESRDQDRREGLDVRLDVRVEVLPVGEQRAAQRVVERVEEEFHRADHVADGVVRQGVERVGVCVDGLVDLFVGDLHLNDAQHIVDVELNAGCDLVGNGALSQLLSELAEALVNEVVYLLCQRHTRHGGFVHRVEGGLEFGVPELKRSGHLLGVAVLGLLSVRHYILGKRCRLLGQQRHVLLRVTRPSQNYDRRLVAHVDELSRANSRVSRIGFAVESERVHHIRFHSVEEEIVPVKRRRHVYIWNN